MDCHPNRRSNWSKEKKEKKNETRNKNVFDPGIGEKIKTEGQREKERKVNHLGVVAAFRRISHRYSVKGMRGLEIGRLIHLWEHFWRRGRIVRSVGHPSACPALRLILAVGVSSLTLTAIIAGRVLAQRDQTIEIEVPSWVSCNVSTEDYNSQRAQGRRKKWGKNL